MGELVPIEEELRVVRTYLYIEKERFGKRLNITWDVDSCEQMKIPFLTIQPIVENAVRHGVLQRIEGGTIHIKVKDYEEYIEVSVVDDGVGMDQETQEGLFLKHPNRDKGIGVLNTDRRLKRYYGKGLQVKSELDVGTDISFIVYKENKASE